jgi:alginate O-acetyltransferase complex protein AlgI
MFLSGLWHGANWTFIVWGLYHGFLLVAERLCRMHLGSRISVPAFVLIPFQFLLVALGWIFFRAESLADVPIFFTGLVHSVGSNMPLHSEYVWIGAVFCLVVQLSTYFDFELEDYSLVTWGRALAGKLALTGRVYAALSFLCGVMAGLGIIAALVLRGKGAGSDFIYFQF